MRHINHEPHLRPSKLILYKGLNKTVKLYRYVGETDSDEFEAVKEYFYHVTPEFALNERLIGFDDYDDIGYYCQENDVWVVEEILNVPLELTVAYEQQTIKDEKDRREKAFLKYIRKQKEQLAVIDEAFEDATYPQRRHDYIFDLINSCRIYVPEGREFFSENGVLYMIREDGDYMMRLSNAKYDHDLCNTKGLVRGIYCYTKYRSKIARIINEACVDETEEFRRLYDKHLTYKGIPKHKPRKMKIKGDESWLY